MKGKIKLMVILLGTLLVLQTLSLAKAEHFPINWDDAIISELRDTPDTPGQTPAFEDWYEDAKGTPGQPENELLYLYVHATGGYIYVRWDVKDSETDLTSTNINIHYVLRIDAVPPIDGAEATHLLILTIKAGQFTVEIRNAAGALLWTSATNPGDWYRITTISIDPATDPFDVRTALEAKFLWSELPGEVGSDFWVMSAESHAAGSNMGSPSVAVDYIVVTGGRVPWFTSLPLVLLVSVAFLAFLRRRGSTSLRV